MWPAQAGGRRQEGGGRRAEEGAGMDALTLFGAMAVTAMVVCYALEARAAGFVLGFAAACLAASLYGFLQGAWLFGVVELIWSGVALRRWSVRRMRDRATGGTSQ